MSKLNIVFERYADLGENIVFPAFNHNALYSMNKNSKQITLLGEIPCGKKCSFRSFFSVSRYENKIILVPFNYDNIVIYDMNKQVFQRIEVKKATDLKKTDNVLEDGKFACSCVFGNKLYAFPHFYPALLILDLDDYSISYDTNLVNEIEKRGKFNGQPYIDDIDVHENIVYGSIGCFNGILSYDMKTKEMQLIDMEYSGEGFNGIKVDGNNIILAPRLSGPIVLYEKEKTCDAKYKVYQDKYNCNIAIPFHGILKTSKGYLFVPALATELVILNIDDDKLKNIQKVSETLRGEYSKAYNFDRLLAYGIYGDIFWYVNGVDQKFYEYKISSGEIKSWCLRCADCTVEKKDILKEAFHYKEKDILVENPNCKLLDFLEII